MDISNLLDVISIYLTIILIIIDLQQQKLMINVCSILVITHQPQLGLVPGMIMIPITSTVACRMALV